MTNSLIHRFKSFGKLFSLVLSFSLLACTMSTAQSMGWEEGKKGMDYLNGIRANPSQHTGTGTQNYWTEITASLTNVKPQAPLHWSPDLYEICKKKAKALAALSVANNNVTVGHVFGGAPSQITGEDREYLTKGILYFANGEGYPSVWKGPGDFYGENVGSLNSGMNVANDSIPGSVAKAIILQLINDYNNAHCSNGAGHRHVLLGMTAFYAHQLHFAMDIHKFPYTYAGQNLTGYVGVVMIANHSTTLRVEGLEQFADVGDFQPYCWLMTEWKGDQLSPSPKVLVKQNTAPFYDWRPLGNGNNQMWALEKAGNNQYRIYNHSDLSKCLSADSQGNLSFVAKTNNDDAQLWTFEHPEWKQYGGMSIPMHRYWIVNARNNQALDSDFTTSPKQRMTGLYWDIAVWGNQRLIKAPCAKSPVRP